MAKTTQELTVDQLAQVSGGSFFSQIVHPKPEPSASDRRKAGMDAIKHLLDMMSGFYAK